MNKKSVFSTASWAIFITAFGLAGSWMIFRAAISKFPITLQQTPVAVIKSTQGLVRKLEAEAAKWNEIKKSEKIRIGDQLYTGRESHANLQFSPTFQLRIESDSLLKLKQDNAKTRLALDFGVLQAQIDPRDKFDLQLARTNHSISCSTSSQFYVFSSDDSITLEVLNGQVFLNGKTIGKNQKAEFDEKGRLTVVEKRTIELSYPRQNENLWRLRDNIVDFQWLPTIQRKYKLVVSNEPFFSRPLIKKEVQGIEQASLRLSKTGRFYWRIEDLHQKGLRSSTFSFDIISEQLPELTYPPHQAHFRLAADHQAEKMTFTFKPASRKDDQYLLEVSKDENFQKIYLEKVVAEGYVANIPLPPGEYFWRIKAINPLRTQALWSLPRKLKIFPHNHPLETPHLLTAQVKKFTQDIVSKNEAQILFDRVFGADSYRIEVKVNDENNPKIITQNSPTFLITDPTPGVHLIRAQAIHPDLISSSWSKTAIAIIEGETKTSVDSKD